MAGAEGERPGRARVFAAAGVVLLCTVAAAAGQQAHYRARVDLVRVPISVLDARGTPVRGLGPRDLELRVNGQPRPIAMLVPVQASPDGAGDGRLAPEESAERPDPATSNGPLVPVAAARRRTLIFFDFTFTQRWSLARARRAVDAFLADNVTPDDLVGVAGYNMISGLQFLAPFSSYHDLVRRAVERIRPGRADDTGPRASDFMDLEELVRFGGAAADEPSLQDLVTESEREFDEGTIVGFLSALERLGQVLRTLPGQKNILLFSHGFVDAAFQYPEVRAALERAATALRDANAVVFTFHPDILRTSNVHDVRSMQSRLRLNDIADTVGRILKNREALHYLADETGGDPTWYKHNLAKGLAAFARRTAYSYVLVFRRLEDDPERLTVDVRPRRGDQRVPGMPRHVAPPPPFAAWPAEARRLQLAEALEPELDRNDLTVEVRAMQADRVATTAGEGAVQLLVAFDGQQLAELAGEDGADRVGLELLGLLLDEADRPVRATKVRLRVPLAAAEPDSDRGRLPPVLQYFDELAAPPGSYRLRVVARETTSGFVGAHTVPIHVAGACDEPLCVGVPVVLASADEVFQMRVRERETAPGGRAYPWRFRGGELVPVLRPNSGRGDALRISVAIEGDALEGSAGSPRIEWVLAAGDRQRRLGSVTTVEEIDDNPVRPGAGRRILVSARLPSELSPGSYRLWATVQAGNVSVTSPAIEIVVR